MGESKRRPAVSDRLRAAIVAAKAAGVSRYRISRATGVEQSALSRFVNGKAGLDVGSVDKLAAFLGLDLVPVDPKTTAAGTRATSKTTTKTKGTVADGVA
ncbi:MAG TPA: helix-turn-helix transcriptional regulator [Humisphaera sp.]